MNIKEIGFICSLVPFQDSAIPFRLLAGRKPVILRDFLNSLGHTEGVKFERKASEQYRSDKEIYSLRMAERILRYVEERHSSPSDSAWEWKWKEPENSTTAQGISSSISSVFSTVPFSDWIRVALGHWPQSFTKLAMWMSVSRISCFQCLKEKPHLRMLYEQLEKASPITAARY